MNEQYLKIRRWNKVVVALTDHAKKYRNHVKDVVSHNLDVAMNRFPVGNVEIAYGIEIDLYFTKLENEGWFKNKTKTRYCKVDADNRIKFLQDAVCKAVGIPDDSQFFRDVVQKFQSPDPHVDVRLLVLNIETFIPQRSPNG